MAAASEDPAILDRAVAHAHRWFGSVPTRRVPPSGTADDVIARLGTDLPEHDRPAAEVMPSASLWHGRDVIRFSVSSWRTGAAEVRDTVRAVARAAQVPTQQPAAVGE